MGKVRTEVVKRTARTLIEHHPNRLSSDFDENKKIVSELMVSGTKRLRNRIAGYVASLKKLEAKRAATLSEAPEEEESSIA